MIKLAVFDIDGTLYDPQEKKYPESTIHALKELSDRGIIIVIATGRPPLSAQSAGRCGIPVDYYLCSNGHLVVGHDGTVLLNKKFSSELADQVWKYCRENDIGLFWKYPDATYIYQDDREFDQIFNKSRVLGSSHSKLVYDNHRIHLTLGPNGGCLACSWSKLEQFNHYFKGRCVAIDINGNSSDLLLYGVDKQTALEYLLNQLSIDPKMVIAFGDNRNDYQFMRYSGISVAMGNAHPVLKKVSDYITGDVSYDGIAEALKHFELI